MKLARKQFFFELRSVKQAISYRFLALGLAGA
jgi:hypothetical protein